MKNMTINLPDTRSIIPGWSRDQTRIARARLAEEGPKQKHKSENKT